jgi:hypothetical protein
MTDSRIEAHRLDTATAAPFCLSVPGPPRLHVNPPLSLWLALLLPQCLTPPQSVASGLSVRLSVHQACRPSIRPFIRPHICARVCLSIGLLVRQALAPLLPQ